MKRFIVKHISYILNEAFFLKEKLIRASVGRVSVGYVIAIPTCMGICVFSQYTSFFPSLNDAYST